MKCDRCGVENKDTAKVCKKCQSPLVVEQFWIPDLRWHIKALGIIYCVVIVGFFVVSFMVRRLPPPYHQRLIAPEMTPWLPQKAAPDRTK